MEYTFKVYLKAGELADDYNYPRNFDVRLIAGDYDSGVKVLKQIINNRYDYDIIEVQSESYSLTGR